jgi:hypothetical protein
MNKNTLNINGVSFQTGDRITCNIHGYTITDAKIFINCASGNSVDCFLCQNEVNGNTSPDLLGYEYSYEIYIPIIHDKYDDCCIEKYDNNIFSQIIEKSFPQR